MAGVIAWDSQELVHCHRFEMSFKVVPEWLCPIRQEAILLLCLFLKSVEEEGCSITKCLVLAFVEGQRFLLPLLCLSLLSSP